MIPKNKYSPVVLSGRTLYNLIPGNIYAIDVETLNDFDFGVYNNEGNLWNFINPSCVEELSNMKRQERK